MAQSLTEIAKKLRDANKKIQLIYAFNGTGKTRLSREFKELVSPKNNGAEEESKIKVLYYNAFTEDLFFWDNDLTGDTNRKLQIQPNAFTSLAIKFLKDEDQDGNIVRHFQHYTTRSITPLFSEDYTEVTFSIRRGGDDSINNIKVSRGEESNFIWCIFFSLIEQVVGVLNTEDDNRSTHDFDDLEYIFIDDPVSSLDDNHVIELAVNLSQLVKLTDRKFIISTHSPLFYNVLHNELNLKNSNGCYLLTKNDDSTYDLVNKSGDSNKSFSYHLHLKQTIQNAIDANAIEKYHFMLLRNLYEKTANFLGYPEWKRLLPEDRQLYYNRIIQFTSHSTLANVSVSEPSDPEKQTVALLLEHLINSKYWKEEIIAENVTV